jgi:uncharacterized protein (DUF1778 family)
MAVNTAKRRERTAKAEAVMKGNERIITSEHYMRDLLHALNYYNSNNNDKDKKKWFITHYAKVDKKVAVALLAVDEFHFRTPGVLARLMDLGTVLQEAEQKHFDVGVEKLMAQIKLRQKSQDKQAVKDAAAAKVSSASNVISIQQRMEEKAHDHAGEIEGAIDDFVLGSCKSDFSTKNYLLANQVAGPIAKRIGELFVDTSKELREALEGKDAQLVEGYSHLTKRELKRFAEFVDGIIADCQQMVQTAKANRAPRKLKPASPTKLVAKMKFMREFAELNLKSVPTTGIIGASEVWYYNTKYRRIGVYKAENGTVSVKGTTIIGFDIKESKAFTLRKPEDFFKGLAMGKRALANAMKTLTTKPSQPNGRINEETIILGAF